MYVSFIQIDKTDFLKTVCGRLCSRKKEISAFCIVVGFPDLPITGQVNSSCCLCCAGLSPGIGCLTLPIAFCAQYLGRIYIFMIPSAHKKVYSLKFFQRSVYCLLCFHL